MFALNDIISVRDLDVQSINLILERAEKMNEALKSGKVQESAKGKLMAALFFEPSTRTRYSFESAMKRLGGDTWGFSSTEGTSMKKGESFIDTIRMADQYVDIIVVRHPREGAARLAAKVAAVPVINGGDGGNQHPTQTLLDLFTIKYYKNDISNQHIALIGDLKHGRTTRSLFYALAMYGSKITLVSPPGLQMSPELIEEVKEKFDVTPNTATDIDPRQIDNPDVFYVIRIQAERFADPLEAKRLEKAYRITPELLSKFSQDLIVMHPLPRVNEIDPSVDSLPQAVYFKQAGFGIPVRMALIDLLLNKK